MPSQVHGGYGYTREYNVEQFYRDNRLNPIHEGTEGIQTLAAYAKTLDEALQRIEEVTRALYGTGDMNKTLANASLYLEAFGHAVVAWVWLQQALLSVGKTGHDADFTKASHAGRMVLARHFKDQ